MGDAEADRLKAALERRFGRRVELERTLDPAVLGGAIVDAGEIVIDGSVRGQLARLETAVRQ
jgi:F-type H+-transporting ATPase subunit delta